MNRPLRLGMLAVLAAATVLGAAGCRKKKVTQGKGGWTAKVVPVSAQQRQRARRRVEALWAEPEVQAEVQAHHPAEQYRNFYRDLVVLTRHGHRLAGYGTGKVERLEGREVKVFQDGPGSLPAGQYVADRLRAMGVEVVVEQDFPVAQPLTVQCELEVAGARYGPADGFHMMRPNQLQASVTPPEGLTGPVVYAGTGRLEEYTGSPQDAIVVMEFAGGDRWLRAFAMGAKAVVFIGADEPVANPWHHLNFPANLPRFYVTAELAERLRLRSGGSKVTIRAAVRWKVLEGRNVIGIIRGTRPRFEEDADEALVLAAPLDSLSEVPALSPGARGAANCAALLSVAEYLLAHRPRRDVVLCFLDGETVNHAGARAFYGAVLRSRAKDAKTTLQERLGTFLGLYDAKTGKELSKGEVDYITGIQQILRKGNIFLDDWRAYLESAEGLSARQLRAQEGRIRDSQRSARAWMRKEARALADDLARNDLQLCRVRKRQHIVEARALRKRLARAAGATRPAASAVNRSSARSSSWNGPAGRSVTLMTPIFRPAVCIGAATSGNEAIAAPASNPSVSNIASAETSAKTSGMPLVNTCPQMRLGIGTATFSTTSGGMPCEAIIRRWLPSASMTLTRRTPTVRIRCSMAASPAAWTEFASVSRFRNSHRLSVWARMRWRLLSVPIRSFVCRVIASDSATTPTMLIATSNLVTRGSSAAASRSTGTHSPPAPSNSSGSPWTTRPWVTKCRMCAWGGRCRRANSARQPACAPQMGSSHSSAPD